MLESYGVSLKAEKPNGQSVLGYSLARGNIDAFLYLLDYYLRKNIIQEDKSLILNILDLLTQSSKQLVT